ncbi:thioredoxin domain-containing protein [Hyunsoonleella pacifica]|uniref:Thioredoxin domain-containing protein n=1 Tax=Hyunsoonleella pacifica TaxID=1080224 RepID=A0A4Q9FP71_9FLAO|nr:thioredoxin domain-containing protein [Hyunsoonleella pacifica]TBN16448.1 thioredoxin domain-containing protein [Hyunsoonleella pacifica]
MKYTLLLFLVILMNCKSQNQESKNQHKYTNALINETSPYLLQHAHNPVDWYAWNNETLEKAKKENKLMLISVGYSSCHWCHVMEHESFEDSLVAQVMNKDFINIKVDREERPDVDQIYMNAVQLMKGSGGWPLNVVALPDGRPIWGDTYLPKEQWISVLNQISKLYSEEPNKLIQQAENIQKGINSISVVDVNNDAPIFEKTFISEAVDNWSKQFDYKFGGTNREPKFMMPNNYHFLLRYAYQTDDKKLLDFVNLTLKKIAFGGVYDHVGGGFSRYSTDGRWHVPHFEKMLYDNAQLVSLYSDAYLLTHNNLYKEVVEETLNFLKSEMTTSEGAFYSSFDADSKTPKDELEEGAFYVWQKAELKTILKEDFQLFSDYYNINNYGLWEKSNYVLIRKDDNISFLKKHDISQELLNEKKSIWKSALSKARNTRPKPRMDDKTLTSWNGLMLKAYVDAYRALQNKAYLDAAEKNADFIVSKVLRNDGGLNHTYKEGKSKINGYLDDYATVIDAFIALYEVSLNDKWLKIANDLANYTFKHFYEERSKLFYYTSNEDASLVSRNMVYHDNVIPSSNSMMAKNLFKLSHYFDNTLFASSAITMLNNVKPEMLKYPTAYSNWFDLMLNYTNPFYEVAIAGQQAKEKISELNQNYIPNKLIAGSTSENNMPLLKHRYTPNKTLIYVCVNKACKLPVDEVDKAINLLNK